MTAGLCATPINVATAVIVPTQGGEENLIGPLLGLMTWCNLMVLGLTMSSLKDVVLHGHGDE